jgi:hypothetical protein
MNAETSTPVPEVTAVVAADFTELSAADILGMSDIEIRPVDVPEWPMGGKPGRVYVRTLSGTNREKYLDSLRKIEGHGRKQTVKVILAEAGAKLLVLTLCDSKGTLLFNAAQIAQLGAKSSKALQRCIDASSELNGLGDTAVDDAKNDSSPTESGDSVSA